MKSPTQRISAFLDQIIRPIFDQLTPHSLRNSIDFLKHLKKHKELYKDLDEAGLELATGIRKSLTELEFDYTVNQLGSMYSLFFTKEKVS